MPASPAAARRRIAEVPGESAAQSPTQTRNGSPWAPARPSAPRPQRSKERKRFPATSVIVKWAR